MSMTTARECVTRGADLLDREVPAWWTRIDLERLEISEAEMCALGQLFDKPRTMPRWQRNGYASLEAAMTDTLNPRQPYWRREQFQRIFNGRVCVANYDLGLYVLGLNETESGRHGFNEYFDDETGESADYAELDEAWREVIELRQR